MSPTRHYYSNTSTVAIFILCNLVFFTYVSNSTKTTLPPKRSGAHSIPAIVPGKKGSHNNNSNGNTNKKCPKDTLKFGVCGSWLGLVTEIIGTKPSEECCTVIKGLADLEAALCLCTAIKANVLGVVTLDVPLALTLLVNACGKNVPEGFACA